MHLHLHYSRFTGLSKKLWQRSLPTFKALTQTPLITGLIRGLRSEEFQYFSLQDIYYLERIFKPVMNILRQKANTPYHQQLFSDFITATDIELVQLKKQIKADPTAAMLQASEICIRYGEHLLETAQNQPYGIGIAACLPCFWFFPALGLHIKNKVPDLSTHPQSEWIRVYAEELFNHAYSMALLVNETVPEEDEQQALEVYRISTEFELQFFKAALPLNNVLNLRLFLGNQAIKNQISQPKFFASRPIVAMRQGISKYDCLGYMRFSSLNRLG